MFHEGKVARQSICCKCFNNLDAFGYFDVGEDSRDLCVSCFVKRKKKNKPLQYPVEARVYAELGLRLAKAAVSQVPALKGVEIPEPMLACLAVFAADWVEAVSSLY